MQNQKSALGLDANITALLGYIIWIVALIVVFIEKDNKFVRFHAIQALLYGALVFVVIIVLSIVSTVLWMISTTLGGLFSLVFLLLWLVILVGIILLAFKAYKGEMFKFPIIGGMAEKWA